MLPDDPLFDRIMWAVIRFVFLPAMMLAALFIVGILLYLIIATVVNSV